MNTRILLIVMLIVLSACSSPTPTTTPIPSPTSGATATTVPTHTVQISTATALPTATQTTISATTIPEQSTPTPAPTAGIVATDNNKMAWFTQYTVGINLSGAEFDRGKPEEYIPGKLDDDYTYHTCQELQTRTEKGAKLVRFPFRPERLVQPLITPDKEHIHELLKCAEQLGVGVILDSHNSGRIVENGSVRLLETYEFADYWHIIADEYGHYPSLVGYDLSNEPHGLEDRWPQLAQAAIDSIRQVDQQTPIIVGGNRWSGAHDWLQHSPTLHQQVTDPAGLLVFQAHQYFDTDFSGGYGCGSAANCGVTVGTAQEKLKPFVEWCTTNHLTCYVGELGVPPADTTWHPVMKEALQYLKENTIPVTLWSAGKWWGGYNLSLENGELDWAFTQ